MPKQWISIKGDLQGKSPFLFKFKEIFQNFLKMPYSTYGLSSSMFSSELQNTENASASEGSKKYHPEDSSPGPSTEKRRRRKRRRNAKYSDHDFQGSVLEVCCGNVKGVLYKDKLAAGGSHKCIKDSEEKWYTPKEFEASGDRARWKTWRKSITCKEFPLEKLMKEGDLPNPPREWKKRSNSKSCYGKTLMNIPGTLMGRHRRIKRIHREDPPRPPRQLAGSKLSAQKTFRTSKKRARKYKRIILHSSSSSSSSMAASPTRQDVISDDNREGISSLPSISSKAVPAKFKPKLAKMEVNAQVIETAALSLPLRQRKQLLPVPMSGTEEEMLPLAESEAAEEEELPPLEGSEEEELLPQGRSKDVLPAWAESEAAEKELPSRVEELPLQSPADEEDNLLPPASTEELEVIAPEMELGEEVLPLPTSTVTAAEELQMEANAVPTAGQQRRHRQRARCLTRCHCSALAPRVLAGIRAVRRDIQAILGQNHSIQDRLLYLEGNARNMQRTLHLFQRTVATREQHCTPATVAEEQALLEQLLEQNSTVLEGLLAIMARLGVAPFDPHF